MFDVTLWKKLARGPQIILLKDAAFISAYTGVQSGDTVVDAGAGSGFLSTYLGSLVAPAGKVFAYERREEFAELSRKNVARAKLSDVVTVKTQDILLGIDEKDVDLVTLDLADAPQAVALAFSALKPKGFCVGYQPHAEQVQSFVKAGQTAGFLHDQTMEVIARAMLVRERGFRPENSGLLHTGYLTFLRKP